jgi:hypothetical protein
MRDLRNASQKQRDAYFTRKRPSSLSHPWLQDLRSDYEIDRESDQREYEYRNPRGLSRGEDDY